MNIPDLLEKYDPGNITIGVLGGHSALDVCRGAKKHGFKTLAVCQKGREQTYAKHYRTRDGRGCVDDTIVLEKFSDIVKPEVQEELRERNTIFIHNRYFWVYCNWEEIEQQFEVPIYGTRHMLKLEERDVEKNQYWLMKQGDIRHPRIFDSPDDIDCLAIVKVNEAMRGYERAFFFAQSQEDYRKKSQELLQQGKITQDALQDAVIEEYIVGAQINLNYFYSPLSDELEIMGTDTRRQTNLDGLLRLPADEQLAVLEHVRPSLIETGHMAATTKESIIEKIFALGEKFVNVSREHCSPGIIGPFALQGAVSTADGKEELVIFDISMRIPGSPLTRFTPHSGYLYGDSISYGERIAMEIRRAAKEGRLQDICT